MSRETSHIQVHLSFIQHKNPLINMWSKGSCVLVGLTLKFVLQKHELIWSKPFEMNWPQTDRNQVSMLGWMRCTLICNNFLSTN